MLVPSRGCIALVLLLCTTCLCVVALAAEVEAETAAEVAWAEPAPVETASAADEDSIAGLLTQISTRLVKRAIKNRASKASLSSEKREHPRHHSHHRAETESDAAEAEGELENQEAETLAFPAADTYSQASNDDPHTDRICLQQVLNDAPVYLTHSVASQSFKTVFACCEEPNHPVGGCMFKTRSATGSGSVQKDFDLSEKVGEFDAHCMFKWPGKCVPQQMMYKMFTTSAVHSERYWLEMEAALASADTPALTVFSGGPSISAAALAAASASVATAAVAEPTGADDVIAVPKRAAAKIAAESSQDAAVGISSSSSMPLRVMPARHDAHSAYDAKATRGLATQLSAKLSPIPGLLLGGSLDYTAGFKDANGEVRCPNEAASNSYTYDAPTLGGTFAPLVKCGLMALTLHYGAPVLPFAMPPPYGAVPPPYAVPYGAAASNAAAYYRVPPYYPAAAPQPGAGVPAGYVMMSQQQQQLFQPQHPMTAGPIQAQAQAQGDADVWNSSPARQQHGGHGGSNSASRAAIKGRPAEHSNSRYNGHMMPYPREE